MKSITFSSLPIWCLIALMIGCMPNLAFSQDDPEAIKERMKKNLRAVDVLKKTGIVGENNKGYLELRIKELSKADRDLLEIENKDRKWVYEYLARQNNIDIVKFQSARAAQIRKLSAAGIWLQSEEGKWYQQTKADAPREP